MANKEHLATLLRCLAGEGVNAWNKWVLDHGPLDVDLSGANLEQAMLQGIDLQSADLRNARLSGSVLACGRLAYANLSGAQLVGAHLDEVNLEDANLSGANLCGADLDDADLEGADLSQADLSGTQLHIANLAGANLSNAVLCGAELGGANLTSANLTGADLRGAYITNTLVMDANLTDADLTGCHVFGVSAWEVLGVPKCQQGLIITPDDVACVTVDDLEIAHFVHLMLKREKLRAVLETITARSVLILGRFTTERQAVLDAIAGELRRHNLIPIIFDFERATSRDFTETIKVLAGLSLFVIADITKPSSVPLELQATIPDYQIPFVPIIQKGEKPFSMFDDLKSKYQWVMKPLVYPSVDVLLQVFKKAILDEAFDMHKRLLMLKAKKTQTRSAEDYLSG